MSSLFKYTPLNYSFTVPARIGTGDPFICNPLTRTSPINREDVLMTLAVKQVFNKWDYTEGRKFLCNCEEKRKTGSWIVRNVTVHSPKEIMKLLNGETVPSPQRRL